MSICEYMYINLTYSNLLADTDRTQNRRCSTATTAQHTNDDDEFKYHEPAHYDIASSVLRRNKEVYIPSRFTYIGIYITTCTSWANHLDITFQTVLHVYYSRLYRLNQRSGTKCCWPLKSACGIVFHVDNITTTRKGPSTYLWWLIRFIEREHSPGVSGYQINDVKVLADRTFVRY